MFHRSLILFQLEIFGVDLNVHGLDLFSSLIQRHFPILNFFLPLLIIPTMLLNFLVKLFLSLFQDDFQLREFLFKLHVDIFLLTDFSY